MMNENLDTDHRSSFRSPTSGTRRGRVSITDDHLDDDSRYYHSYYDATFSPNAITRSSRRSSIFDTMPTAPVTTENRRNKDRRGSFRVEPSGAMNRLRSSMGGRSVSVPDELEVLATSLPPSPTSKSYSTVSSSSATTTEPSSAADSMRNNKYKHEKTTTRRQRQKKNWLLSALGQVPAIALIGMFHLMIGIPFGVSYFPMNWSNSYTDEDSESGGPFPLPGKASLGIRMFLFSTFIGQLAFTGYSRFDNPIGLQMVENVPFCHELASIVISHQGYGLEAMSTLIVMFGLSSLVVGIVFYMLGKFNLGRIVYFFPTHVLIGCIGGIGVYLIKTGVEVTIGDTFSIESLIEDWNLLWVGLAFEAALRVLDKVCRDVDGQPLFALLTPIYFCMITPIFYAILYVSNISIDTLEEAGYFFPPLEEDGNGTDSGTGLSKIFADPHIWDMWTVINLSTVSWVAIWESLPVLLALTLFSLIHVPINIPAFALSTGTEADMNAELIAHGYSNMMAGILGGLQNYMAYTQSVLYDKSGGTGKISGVAVAVVTMILFFVGPTVASYIPRCMAGALLIHVGIDLFLEGVLDSIGKFDPLEYSGIWLIVVVMTIYGMEAAMVGGIISAVSAYAVQSVTYLSPIRGHMPATTLRSSQLNRSYGANFILDSNRDGRSRILVVQLQGHLFFGNMAHFTEAIHETIDTGTNNDTINDVNQGGNDNNKSNKNNDNDNNKNNGDNNDNNNVQHNILPPLVIILDFSLVLGIDSSAAQTISKMKDSLLSKYSIEVCIFVTGSEFGFPTEFDLSKHLSSSFSSSSASSSYQKKQTDEENDDDNEEDLPLEQVNEETALLLSAKSIGDDKLYRSKFVGSHVLNSLDLALSFAEDALIVRKDPSLLRNEEGFNYYLETADIEMTVGRSDDENRNNETNMAIRCFQNLCPIEINSEDGEYLFSLFTREVYKRDEYVWYQHSTSDSVKLLLYGMLIAELENEAGTTELISSGTMIGELGLVNGNARMSSVKCLSEFCIVYSMSRDVYDEQATVRPKIVRYIDLICVKYLALRVQHVSNRIFETRCLPI